jgi:hypothetical protein
MYIKLITLMCLWALASSEVSKDFKIDTIYKPEDCTVKSKNGKSKIIRIIQL